MSAETRHEYLQELLAAAALHAVSTDEQRAVEEHIATCNECRAEYDEHVKVASLLGSEAALPPEHVWEKLSSRLEEPPPPVRLVRERRWLKPVAIAAVLLLIVGGALVAVLTRSDSPSQTEVALAALTQPGARKTVLVSSEGQDMADAVVLPDGRGYLLDDHMAPLPADRTYQLWAVVSGTIVSAGVLGNDPGTIAFNASGDLTALAVTVEKAGGVVSSTNTAVASGKFA